MSEDFDPVEAKVPWWHPAATELEYWKNECGRLHLICRDRYVEIERLLAEVLRLTRKPHGVSTMTSNPIVERLRSLGPRNSLPNSLQTWANDAADEIERLRAALDKIGLGGQEARMLVKWANEALRGADEDKV
jgi:hypothetical protein